MKHVYLLTGRPGAGKTSLIKEVAAQMKGRAGGFYTEEIRSRGTREGFRLVTLDGEEGTLAHINIRSPLRVSRYGINIDVLEQLGVAAILKAIHQDGLIIIDEIGKMELFSVKFREAATQAIDSGKKVLATIMLNPNPWADVIKNKPQVNLITVTRDNYQSVLAQLLSWLGATDFPKL